MEHRYFSRRKVEALASVYCQNTEICRGQVSDISRGGMKLFVKRCPVQVGDIIRIQLRSPGVDIGNGGMVRAMVIHHNQNNLGLMFDDVVSE